MNKINKKVAIVTGGAKNIGRATCIELAKLNFNILAFAVPSPNLFVTFCPSILCSIAK